ncbi:MAG: hypothetical protein LC127_08265 [Chitinophagales bacterium]|nr:hypothetical protein [Chitinophagales bacterium]
MLTLNQVKKILVDYFVGHAQIKQVIYGNDVEFNADRQINYPACNIEYLNSDVSGKLLNYNYKIVLADISNPDDDEMSDNIISDALQIAEDFLSYLEYTEGFIFNGSSNLEPFLDDTGDRTTGIVFTLAIGTIRNSNWCNKPVN